MSTDLAHLAANPTALELAADPGEFVVLACERAKQWLTEALNHGDIDQLVELKSQAEAIRVYTAQKQIGKDAELSAAEIVRRAERGIGVAIRRGQEAGEIETISNARSRAAKISNGTLQSGGPTLQKRPIDYVEPHELSGGGHGTGIWDVTDNVSDDLFEDAIGEAKAEGNLSRANVVRKVRGEATPTGPRNEWHRKRRNLDGNRIIREAVLAIDGVAAGLSLLDELDDLDDVTVEDWWLDSLNESIPKIRKLRDLIKGITE